MSHPNPSWKAHTHDIFSEGYNTAGWIFLVCSWLILWCTEAMSIFPPCSIKMELCGLQRGFTCLCYHRSCSDIALQGAFWPTPDTHSPEHTFRMCPEPSETSLLISSTLKHSDTHVIRVVPLNTSRLIKIDSWLTGVCVCLAVNNLRLPALTLMCKLQSSQTHSCYRAGIKKKRGLGRVHGGCGSCRAPCWN